MSKQKKPMRGAAKQAPTQRSRLPAVMVASALLVAAVTAILLLQSARQPVADTSIGAGRPELVVDQERIDFGAVPVDQMVKASFKLSNSGDKPLILSVPALAQVVEGC